MSEDTIIAIIGLLVFGMIAGLLLIGIVSDDIVKIIRALRGK